MPDYKKKKINKFLNSPSKIKKSRIQKNKVTDDIKMKSSNGSKKNTIKKPEVKVIEGKKESNKRKLYFKTLIISFLVLAVIITNIILPGGIIETIYSTFSLIGNGSFPIELESAEIIDTVSQNSHFYVLTDSSLNAFSNSGKKLFSYVHGFENPVIKTSSTRAILYNQGGNQLIIFSLKEMKHSLTTKNSIITANISDSGRFAVVTNSEKYTATVSVYDKRAEKVLYEWYSAEKLINSVAVSPNGKKIAVSLLKSSVGNFDSELYVLNYKSANPEYSIGFNGQLIYDINSSHSSVFTVVTDNSLKFIKWSNLKSTDYNNDYNTAFFRSGKGGYFAVFNRESNKVDNKISVFSKKGVLKYDVKFNDLISDIKIWNRHIYCISDNKVLLLSDDGKVIRSAQCDFGIKNLVVTGATEVVVVSSDKIQKIKLEQE